MPGQQIVCQACGQVFEDRAIVASAGAHVVINGATSIINCPHCGALNQHSMTGSYRVQKDGTWRSLTSALTNPSVTRQDFADLVEIIQHGQDAGTAPVALANQIKRTIPKLAAVGDFLLSQKGSAAAAWVAVVLMVVIYLLQESAPEPATPAPSVVAVNVQAPSEEDVDRLIQRAVQAQHIEDQDHDRALIDEAVKRALAAQQAKNRDMRPRR